MGFPVFPSNHIEKSFKFSFLLVLQYRVSNSLRAPLSALHSPPLSAALRRVTSPTEVSGHV